MFTKNDIRARIEQIQRLETEVKSLRAYLVDTVSKTQGFDIGRKVTFDNILSIGTLEGDIDKCMASLEERGLFEGLQEGDEVLSYPYLSIQKESPRYVEIACLLNKEGDKLVAYTAESDTNTLQAGTVYKTANENLFDLCMVERKQGDLAEVHGLKPDNEDIDIFTWEDITQEDYTHKGCIKKEDIDEIDRELNEETRDLLYE